MRRLFLGLAICAGLVSVSAPAATQPSAPPAAAGDSLEALFRTGFRQGFMEDELGRFIVENFPDDFTAFESSVLRDIQAGSFKLETMEERGQTFAAEILVRDINHQRSASDETLVGLGQANLALMTALQADGRTAECRRLGEDGMIDDSDQPAPSKAVTEATGALTLANFKAIASGRDRPVKRKPASNGDFKQAVKAFTGLGGDMDWLIALDGGDRTVYSDTMRCEQSIIFARSLLALKPAVTARILAPE